MRIIYGIFEDDLCKGIENIDQHASVANFVRILEPELMDAFPDAEILGKIIPNTTSLFQDGIHIYADTCTITTTMLWDVVEQCLPAGRWVVKI